MDIRKLLSNPRLQDLTILLGGTLYAVGGAVRDLASGFEISDVDIAAPMPAKKVIELLAGSKFSVATTSEKMGTLKISFEGESWEYTSFRTDSYADGGYHSPREVRFTADISADAFRRDFTINAVYVNLSNGVIVDPTGGLNDILSGIIRSTRAAKDVLKEDGLRLLRLVRIAAETGFDIAPDVLSAARENAALLADIAPERKKDELCKILVSDTKNGIKEAQYRGLVLLRDLGLLNYVLPLLCENDGCLQNPSFHKYDVLEHIFQTVKFSPPEVRLSALMHDAAKARAKKLFGNMHRHAVLGAELTREALSGLRFSNATVDETAALVEMHMFDLNCETGEGKVRCFVQQNFALIEKLCKLKEADCKARGFDDNRHSASAERLIAVRDDLLCEGIPLSIKDLKIGGADLIELGVAPQRRAEVLRLVLKGTANNRALLTREGQLKYVKGLI